MLETFAWDDIDSIKVADEAEVVVGILAAAALKGDARQAVVDCTTRLVEGARKSAQKQDVVESSIKEFSLGTRKRVGTVILGQRCADRGTL